MSSISLTPMTQSSTLMLQTSSVQAQQQQQQQQRSSTPSLQQQQQLLLSEIEKSESLLKGIDTIEIIPILFELIESVKLGKISPKDFDNAAGRLRVRVNKLKTLLNSIEGLDESNEDKLARIEELNVKYEKKKQLLAQIKQSLIDKVDKLQDKDVEMDNLA